jgi:hypothetical protein
VEDYRHVTTADTDSSFDGAANTAAMVTAGIDDHPAANFCVGSELLMALATGICQRATSWTLPTSTSNLSTTANNTSWGTNIYAVPQRNSNWTTTYPTQTALTAFNTSAEAFDAG